MNRIRFIPLVSSFCLALFTLDSLKGQTPIPVKVVVVTTFELGQDTGDLPGEFQFWYERAHLTHKFDQPVAYHPYYMNEDGVLVMVTGECTARAAASIMLLGMDPRFDFTHSYWLLAGIAGGNPARTSLGSAVWAEWIVNGDLASLIDSREIPADWPDGFIPSYETTPTAKPKRIDGEVYHLNADLTEWAFRLTEHVPLADSKKMADYRARFVDYPITMRPPFVSKGDNLSASIYWQGKLLTNWAERWTNLWTNNQGHFATTACEDAGMMQSLTFLAKGNRVDLSRVMDLRTISDICLQPPGMTAAQSLSFGQEQPYIATPECFDAAYNVGSKVVHELTARWSSYRDHLPKANTILSSH